MKHSYIENRSLSPVKLQWINVFSKCVQVDIVTAWANLFRYHLEEVKTFISDGWSVSFNEPAVSGYSTIHVYICRPVTISIPHIYIHGFLCIWKQSFPLQFQFTVLSACTDMLRQRRMSQAKGIIQSRNVSEYSKSLFSYCCNSKYWFFKL